MQYWVAYFPSSSLVLGILLFPFLSPVFFQAFPFFPALRGTHRHYCKEPCRWWLTCHQCLLIVSEQSSGPGIPSSKEPHGFPRLPARSTPVACDTAAFPILRSAFVLGPLLQQNQLICLRRCLHNPTPLCLYSQSPCSAGLNNHTTTSLGVLSPLSPSRSRK